MSDGYRIAIIGASGAVGGTVLTVLSERRELPIGEVVLFASPRSEGKLLDFRGQELPCRVLDDQAVQGFDLVFSAAGGKVSLEWAPKFEDAGAIVIDKTSAWRMHPDVKLIVPEVNPREVDNLKRRIIASPNCSTMQMVVALNEIHKAATLKEIVVSTYQSVSGTGRAAVDELKMQTQAILNGDQDVAASVYPHQIAFNALPQVETFDDALGGYTTEEVKMMRETRKILGFDPADDDGLPITATCVRVPVLNCHSEAIRIETENQLSPDDCRDLLRRTEGVVLVDDPSAGQYPLATTATGKDDVYVGRVRAVPGRENCLCLWVVGDNLRKGAATNAVQIAELLHRQGLVGQEKYAGSPQYA